MPKFSGGIIFFQWGYNFFAGVVYFFAEGVVPISCGGKIFFRGDIFFSLRGYGDKIQWVIFSEGMAVYY